MPERAPTVVHVITDLSTGGAEMMLCRLVEELSHVRHRVVSLMGDGPLAPRLREAGASVDELGFRQGRPSLAGTGRLLACVRRYRPDVLQGWMYHGNLAATLAQLGLRPRPGLVWGVHQSLQDLSQEKPLTQKLIRVGARLSRRPDQIVYCSQASARQHEALGYAPERTAIIPNGIDCAQFQPQLQAGRQLRAACGIAGDTLVAGMIARYHPMKDHANLIAAAGQAATRVPLHLVLVGPGVDPANQALQDAIAEAGLTGRVSLLGERRDVPDLVAGFDCLVVPSAWGEAFPLVLCEAMASGTPCIATDIGDSAWIIGETGLVVPRRDSEALAQALERFARFDADERARRSAAARARITQNFALPEIARRYQALYPTRERLAA